jgi:hypothetical protein
MANKAGRFSNKRDRSKSKRWSARITQHSNALDLEPKVFRSRDPRKIACPLKRSAERSKRRKGRSYQSAMSMLNFYINCAGKNLPQTRKRILEIPRRNCAMSLAAYEMCRFLARLRATGK